MNASADLKLSVTQDIKSVVHRVKNMVGKGKKQLSFKEKMLVTSIFSFSNNVFKKLVQQGRQNWLLCGKTVSELTRLGLVQIN